VGSPLTLFCEACIAVPMSPIAVRLRLASFSSPPVFAAFDTGQRREIFRPNRPPRMPIQLEDGYFYINASRRSSRRGMHYARIPRELWRTASGAPSKWALTACRCTSSVTPPRQGNQWDFSDNLDLDAGSP